MAVFDLIIRATQARSGAAEFAQAGQQVQRSARDAAASVDRLDREMDELGPRARRAGAEIETFGRRAGTASASMTSLGRSIGLPLAAFTGYRVVSGAVREIAAFEKGVIQAAKAADIADHDLGGFEKRIREIALIRGLDQSAVDLAEIAAIAGTLGVRGTDNLARFTETTAKLTSSLRGLSAEDVATGMGRILQVTGEGAENAERFGNVLARLEDTVAGGASEIINTSREIALATARYNASSTDVLGLGAAFTDLGVQSELARSTVVRTLSAMSLALATGGEEADEFARIVGVSADELRKQLGSNAVSTLVAFARGLNRVAAEGEDVGVVLQGLGIDGVRLAPVLQTLAERNQTLADTIETARREAEEQAKLNSDLARNSDTLSSAWNNLTKRATELAFATDDRGLSKALRTAVDAANFGVTAFDALADSVFLLPRTIRAVREELDASFDVSRDQNSIAKVYEEANAAALEFHRTQNDIYDAEIARRQDRDEANSPEARKRLADIVKQAEQEQAEARKKAAAEVRASLEQEARDRESALDKLREFNVELRKQAEILRAEAGGADSAGLRGLGIAQDIDEQTGALLQLGARASEVEAIREESKALEAEIVGLIREQEAAEQAAAAAKEASADAAREKAKAEREAAAAIEQQRREQERALAAVNQSIGDARFEAGIAGLSQDDQQRARELARFQEQADAAFGAGSGGATAAVEEFKAALDFRDQQADLRDLSDVIARDLTGSVRGLSDAFRDGKVTSQEFGEIVAGVLNDLASSLTEKLLIEPLTDGLSDGIYGLLNGSGLGGGSTDNGVAAVVGNGGPGGNGGSGGSGGNALAGIGQSVGTMTVQAGSVIVNGGAVGGGGGGLSLGGSGGGGVDFASYFGSGGTGGYQSASSLGLTSASDPFGGVDVAQLGGVDALSAGGLGGAGAGASGLGGLGGLGAVGSGLGIVSGLATGNDQAVGQGVGQIAGTALGSLIPIPGAGLILGPLLGSLFGGLFAKGGVFGAGSVHAKRYALGGVVGSPSYFNTPDGLASVAEVNEEGILPLGRNQRGELGVKTAGGGGGRSTVVFNITTPNADSFRRAQSQIARRQEREDRRRRSR